MAWVASIIYIFAMASAIITAVMTMLFLQNHNRPDAYKQALLGMSTITLAFAGVSAILMGLGFVKANLFGFQSNMFSNEL